MNQCILTGNLGAGPDIRYLRETRLCAFPPSPLPSSFILSPPPSALALRVSP